MQKGIFLQDLNTKSRTVNNAIIQLGDIDDSGKGRKFVSKFIQPGLVKIEGHGIVLLKKETLDASLPTIVGSPVIIQHKDVTEENADELRCGVIANAYFNQPDGWYYVDGIIWDDKAQELINKGWSVSCSYDFLAFNDEGGEENNIHYDKEFTQLNFTHLAIVDNPRYERANIVFNSKVKSTKVNNEDQWITIHPNGKDAKGKHLLLKDGETPKEAIERTYGNSGKSDTKDKESYNKAKGRAQKALDLAKKTVEGKELSKQEKDWLNSNKSADELSKDKQSDSTDKNSKIQKALGNAISEFYSDDVDVSAKTLKELRELSGRDISKDEVIEIADQVTTDHDWDKAIKRLKGSKEDKEKQNKTEDKHGFKKDKDSGYYMKDLSDGTSVYVEKKEGGQGEKEPFYLEATHFDKDGKEIAKKQYHYDSMDGMFGKIDKDFVSKDKQSETKKESNTTKDTRRHIDRIEKLIKKYNLEPHEEDELLDELGSFEAKLDEGLEPREEEELREQLFDFEDDIKRHQEMKKEEGKEKSKHISKDYDLQTTLEMKIDSHYDDDFISKEYAQEMSELLGTQITEDDIWDAMEKSRPSKGSGDYSITKMSTELQKTAKNKIKKQKEWDKKQADIRKQDTLRYDLKSMLKRISPYADYRYDEEEKTLEVRYFGDWEGDDGSGDYDWQTPTKKTVEKVREIKDEFKKRYGYELESDWSEKNWYYFKIKETKKNKTNNSKEQDMAIIDELKKLIFKVENQKENKMDSKSKILSILNEKEVDKETIEEIKNELEKIEEKEEEKKVDNEDEENEEKVEELKKEEKKDVDNKCKNSKEESSFDKINAIYNSVKQVTESSSYVSRQEKLDNAVEYFK